MANKITFDLDTYKLLGIDMNQVLVVGQKDSVVLDLYFKQGDKFVTDTSWGVYLTFERPDGSKSNESLALLNNDHYEKYD